MVEEGVKVNNLSVKLKLMIAFVLLITLSLGSLGSLLYYQTVKQLDQDLGEKLLGIVQSTALSIKGEEHKKLKSREDEKEFFYQQLHAYLHQVKESNGLTYLYTIQPKGQDMEILVDSSKGEEKSHLGEYYAITNELLKKAMQKAFNGQASSIPGLYTDQDGTYKSACAPIKDENGRVIAILEGDISAQKVLDIKKRFLNTLLIFIVVSLAFTLLLSMILANYLTKPINILLKTMDELAERGGDLTQRVTVNSKDELGNLGQATNKILATIQKLVKKTILSSVQLAKTSHQVSASSQQIGAGANETAATMSQIATTVEQVSSNIQKIAQDSEVATFHAQEGNKQIIKVTEQMQNITNSSEAVSHVIARMHSNSQEINQIVEIITNIADQTNLLALNAAIEAARAGEQGKGFAVVAEEVRKLAEQSACATKEIFSLTQKIQLDSEQAVKKMEEGKKDIVNGNLITREVEVNFQQIIDCIHGLSNKIQEVAAATQEMSAGVENVASSVEEQTSALEEISDSTVSLAEYADSLQELVAQFKVE